MLDLKPSRMSRSLAIAPGIEHTRSRASASLAVPIYEEELWTSRQRQGNSLHEISYRGCFKPQLPNYFLERLSAESDVVYDPFSGRGTTAIEAALLGRRAIANDINPLSAILTRPRLEVPDLADIQVRLRTLRIRASAGADIDLSMFYNRRTEAEIVTLRDYLRRRREAREEDAVDRWIRMVATNRLTGHSPGFFSVYTLPPNQAVAPDDQLRINRKLGQKPPYRDTRALILRKSVQLQSQLSASDRERLRDAAARAIFLCTDAAATRAVPAGGVQLTVTSPPFLDVVQYARDNWLRCWFNGLDADAIGERITMARTPEEWAASMSQVFAELYRLTAPGGWVAFEVGEVRRGAIRLDEIVAPVGINAGFDCGAVLINAQRFTKTANIWGVENNRLGTNSNRIVLFRKPD
jgi:hypothetical protein